MKNKKKLLSLLLVFVMALTMFQGFAAKAESSITVTLRVEQDEATLVPPVQVTLTDADKKDYGIGLETETLTPLHALAKYLTEKKGATDDTMRNYIKASQSQYGLYVEGINTDGTSDGSPSAGTQDGTSWMYAVNNTSPNVGMGSYELKASDSITLYGIWGGGDWPNNVETNYTYFDKNEYTVKKNTALSLSLKGLGYDADYNSIVKEMKDASVIAASYTDETSTATEKNATVSAKTDDTGTASLTFQTAGKYVLSAYRKAADGIHYDISRPYAIVTVTDDDTPTATPTSTPTSVPTATPTSTPSNVPTATPAATQSPAPSATPSEAVAPPVSAKAPAKPTSVKAVVKKSTKKKKTVTLTWKKVKSASGYRVTISTKKNKGFKKLADVKKTKLTFKKKKGTYYVKVKAYIDSGNKRIYSKASKTLKIKVK